MRKADFKETPFFQADLARYAANNPAVEKAYFNFLTMKSERPPLALPRGMRDHKLNPPLDGFSECHLSGNACLIYTDKNNIVTLITVVDHDDMMGGKVKALAKKIAHLKPPK